MIDAIGELYTKCYGSTKECITSWICRDNGKLSKRTIPLDEFWEDSSLSVIHVEEEHTRQGK